MGGMNRNRKLSQHRKVITFLKNGLLWFPKPVVNLPQIYKMHLAEVFELGGKCIPADQSLMAITDGQ